MCNIDFKLIWPWGLDETSTCTVAGIIVYGLTSLWLASLLDFVLAAFWQQIYSIRVEYSTSLWRPRPSGALPASKRQDRGEIVSLIYCCFITFQCGPLKEVRLVKNRAGKSKGFAYIEYLNEVHHTHLGVVTCIISSPFTRVYVHVHVDSSLMY